MATVTMEDEKALREKGLLLAQRFQATSGAIREVLQTLQSQGCKEKEMSAVATKLALLFMDYKALSRANFTTIEACRNLLLKRKKELDARHLQLENLQYEKDHIERSIVALRDFQMRGLEQINSGEGQALFAEEITELNPSDVHQRTLDALVAEREKRSQLNNEYQETARQQAQLTVEVQRANDLLEGLPKELATVAEGGAKLQQYLSIHLMDRADGFQQLTDLSEPLYVLFRQLDGYCDAFDTSHTSIRVAVVPTEQPGMAGDGSSGHDGADSDRMEVEGEKGKPRYHGSSVRLELDDMVPGKKGRSQVTTTVVFSHDVWAGVIMVEVKGFPLMLINLFPRDTGGSLPSAGGAMANKDIPLNYPADTPAKPYQWAQWLSGLVLLPASRLSQSYSARCIIDRLRSRVRAHRVLESLMGQVSKRPESIPVHESVHEKLQAGTTPKLWTSCDLSKLSALPDPDPFSPLDTGLEGAEGADWARFGATYYQLLLKHRDGAPNITALVEVTPEYPMRPSRVHILSSGPVMKPEFKTIQAEVNAYYDELLPTQAGVDGMNWLLPHQLRRLLLCLEAADGGGAGRVGKDRRLALSVDLQARMLLHR